MSITREQIAQWGELDEWTKEPGEVMSWSGLVGFRGAHFFSFDDGKTIYSVFGGGKDDLPPEQLAIFKKENPVMAELYLSNKD